MAANTAAAQQGYPTPSRTGAPAQLAKPRLSGRALGSVAGATVAVGGLVGGPLLMSPSQSGFVGGHDSSVETITGKSQCAQRPARIEAHSAPAYVPTTLPGTLPACAVSAVGGAAAAAVTLLLSARTRRTLRRRIRQNARIAMAQSSQPLADLLPEPLPEMDRMLTKAFRKELSRSENYFRFSKSQMDAAMADLNRVSGSELLAQIRANGFRRTVGDVTFVLAESYGFCWGVNRTLAMAYEARRHFQDKTIWVTNEIIHNRTVNDDLEKMGMRFVEVAANGVKDFSHIQSGDVVILPAFGASVDEMAFLQQRGAQIVDATCPWVAKVWNSVEKSKDKGATSIIHGKYNHEETIATKSFANTYLVVKDLVEAEYVAEYILGNGDRADFMRKFQHAMSADFDPDLHLDCIGVANQTTMMKGETELIGKLLERAMIRKYGPQSINQHFVAFNTICDATQHRQDAMYKLLGTEYEAPVSTLYAELEGEQHGVVLASERAAKRLSSKEKEAESRGGSAVMNTGHVAVDLCLIVGGFNSSNTSHLIEIPLETGVPAYHIDCPERIGEPDGPASNTIQHKPISTPPSEAMLDRGLEVKHDFLPEGPIVVGVTSGASTPDSVLGECLLRILSARSPAAHLVGVSAVEEEEEVDWNDDLL